MSDEFCAGVQILLKRVESNPEDFMREFGPWKRLVDAVLAYKRGGDYDDRQYLKSLTDAEIDALYKAFLPLARQHFDSWVMKEVLNDKEEQETPPYETLPYQVAQGKRVAQGANVAQGWTDPRMNAVPPGGIVFVGGSGGGGSGQVQIKPESVMSRLKRELGL